MSLLISVNVTCTSLIATKYCSQWAEGISCQSWGWVWNFLKRFPAACYRPLPPETVENVWRHWEARCSEVRDMPETGKRGSSFFRFIWLSVYPYDLRSAYYFVLLAYHNEIPLCYNFDDYLSPHAGLRGGLESSWEKIEGCHSLEKMFWCVSKCDRCAENISRNNVPSGLKTSSSVCLNRCIIVLNNL